MIYFWGCSQSIRWSLLLLLIRPGIMFFNLFVKFSSCSGQKQSNTELNCTRYFNNNKKSGDGFRNTFFTWYIEDSPECDSNGVIWRKLTFLRNEIPGVYRWNEIFFATSLWKRDLKPDAALRSLVIHSTLKTALIIINRSNISIK